MESQKELDIEFVDEYKRLERLLKDIYSNENSVSSNIHSCNILYLKR